ncbi:MAG: hypothetical protein ACQEP1_00870 [Nanobdellota archaeon]
MVGKNTGNGIAFLIAGIAASKIGAMSAESSYAESSGWVPGLAIFVGIIYISIGLFSKTNTGKVEKEEKRTMKKNLGELKDLFKRDKENKDDTEKDTKLEKERYEKDEELEKEDNQINKDIKLAKNGNKFSLDSRQLLQLLENEKGRVEENIEKLKKEESDLKRDTHRLHKDISKEKKIAEQEKEEKSELPKYERGDLKLDLKRIGKLNKDEEKAYEEDRKELKEVLKELKDYERYKHNIDREIHQLKKEKDIGKLTKKLAIEQRKKHEEMLNAEKNIRKETDEDKKKVRSLQEAMNDARKEENEEKKEENSLEKAA